MRVCLAPSEEPRGEFEAQIGTCELEYEEGRRLVTPRSSLVCPSQITTMNAVNANESMKKRYHGSESLEAAVPEHASLAVILV